jgi:hypothetical protein
MLCSCLQAGRQAGRQAVRGREPGLEPHPKQQVKRAGGKIDANRGSEQGVHRHKQQHT